MITIRFKTEMITLTTICSLADVLTMQGYQDTDFAIALNRHFIPRQHYAATFLKEGDTIDVVSPMQGG